MENHANTETQWWGMCAHSGLDLTGRRRTTTIVLHPVTRSTWQLFIVKPFPLSVLRVKCHALEKILWPKFKVNAKKLVSVDTIPSASSDSPHPCWLYTVPHGSVCVKSAELPNCVLCHGIKIRNSLAQLWILKCIFWHGFETKIGILRAFSSGSSCWGSVWKIGKV